MMLIQRFLWVTALILLAACGSTPTYEFRDQYSDSEAKAVIRKTFEQQTEGLRPLSIEVSQELISLMDYKDGRQVAVNIYFEDISELLLRHKRRYAVIIVHSLQSGVEHRKLEFDHERAAFDFMDAVNTHR